MSKWILVSKAFVQKNQARQLLGARRAGSIMRIESPGGIA